MCGRYTAAKDFTELIKLVGVIMSRVPIFGPRYKIAPTQLAPVICIEPVRIDRDMFERQWWGDE
jgi:putative SOS response-associated peptidase YedK